MLSRRLFMLFTVGLIIAIEAGAEPLKSVDEIFDFSSAKMSSYNTWSADFSQTMSVFGGQMVSKGQITHKLPRKMRMQMEMPMFGHETKMAMTMVLGDDGIMWQEMNMAGMKQVMKIDMNKAMSNMVARMGMKIDPLKSMDPSQQWATTKEMLDYALAGTDDLHGQPVYVLEGTWKQSARTNQQVAAIAALTGRTRLYVGQQDGFVRKMEQYDKSNTNLFMRMELSNLKFNQDAPDELFAYQPPPNMQVMDMTQMMGAAMGGRPLPPRPAPPAPPASQPPASKAPGK